MLKLVAHGLTARDFAALQALGEPPVGSALASPPRTTPALDETPAPDGGCEAWSVVLGAFVVVAHVVRLAAALIRTLHPPLRECRSFRS